MTVLSATVLRVGAHPAMVDGADTVNVADIYDLDQVRWQEYRGLIISGSCDQRFLARHGEAISSWVAEGGRILVNGHPVLRWLPGLPAVRKLEFHTQRDLWLSEVSDHPIWRGIDRRDLLFSTGVPGEHSFEDLCSIGVAGFYAHAYLVDLPPGGRTITGIGMHCLPVDVAYPWGAGEVIVHCGNDLGGPLADRVLDHLGAPR